MTNASPTVDVFQALADPNRRRLLDLLAARELAVQELAARFEITVQAVSQHLRVLSDAGLVARRKAGRYRYYRARPEGLAEVRDWLAHHEALWQGNLDRLARYVEERE